VVQAGQYHAVKAAVVRAAVVRPAVAADVPPEATVVAVPLAAPAAVATARVIRKE